MSNGFIPPQIANGSWLGPATSALTLPVNNNVIGDARIAIDTASLYVWEGTAWQVSDSGSPVLTVTGVAPIISSGGQNVAISITEASGTSNGYLSSTDWLTFNSKQASGNYITALTGDVSATGPGSSVATLATVNSSPGTYTYATVTVNAKGLITLASNGSAPPGGTVTSVSVASSNGLSGTVATPTTTPAITLATTFTGIAYSTGTALQTAVAGNFPTLNQNTSGTASNITASSNSSLTTLSALSLPYSQITGAPSSITALTGDVTASGPGSAVSTLASVNSNIGSFTYANITVNAKGLITAASNGTAPTTYSFIDSIVNTSGSVALKNDSASPASYSYYGTNTAGTLGYQTLPSYGQVLFLSGTGATWTTPSSITTNTVFKIVLVGGGGGGGGRNTAADTAPGGGGGGTVILYVKGLSPSTGYVYSVGAAGTAGIGTGTPSTSGGNTSITFGGNTIIAGGGTGGGSTVINGGAGGTNTTSVVSPITNLIQIGGQYGGAASAGSSGNAGSGGSSGLGWGLGGAGVVTAGGGTVASGYGGGGAGGHGASSTGGNGTAGIIVIEYWG